MSQLLNSEGVFKGRTIAVVHDLSIDEQIYLYNKTREVKKRIRNNEPVSDFQLNDPLTTAYLVFLEDSTRTRESFKMQ